MPSPSEKEMEHYREVVRLIYSDKPADKLNQGARLILADMKIGLPDVSDDVIRVFVSSVSYMMAHLSHLSVHDIADAMESIFDHHMLVAAHLLGIIDIDTDSGDGLTVSELIAKGKEEMDKRRDAAKRATTVNPDDYTGMFL